MPSLGDSSPSRSACLNVACASLLSITPKFECCWCFRMPRCSLWQLEQSLIMERYVWVPTSCFHWRCHNLKCFVHSDCVSHYYCAGEKLILLNLLLAVQFLQRPRALPAFTRLNKLDKETITCEFPETPDGLIYFYCSLFLRETQLWFFFFNQMVWIESCSLTPGADTTGCQQQLWISWTPKRSCLGLTMGNNLDPLLRKQTPISKISRNGYFTFGIAGLGSATECLVICKIWPGKFTASS